MTFKKFLLGCFTLALAANMQLAQAANPKVKMETSKGTVIVELYPDKAPVTVKNFLRYVNEGHYDGTIFHRVIKNFMNQGGGFTADYKRKETHDPIKNEADNGLQNLKYTIAMARTNDPHSATDQFFINTKDNAFLDHTSKTARGWGYAVFGKVIDGKDVMSKIARVKTTGKGPFASDVPVVEVVIRHMSEIKE